MLGAESKLFLRQRAFGANYTINRVIKAVSRCSHYQQSQDDNQGASLVTVPTGSMFASQMGVSLWILLGPTTPEVRLTLDQKTFEFLSKRLNGVVSDFENDGAIPFIHREVYGESMPLVLRNARAICQVYRSDNASSKSSLQQTRITNKIQYLLRWCRRADSFQDILASTQALMFLLISLFPTIGTANVITNAIRAELVRCKMRLWEKAPAHLPNSMSTWQAWTLAETVRRTILFTHTILGHSAVLKQGYFTHTLFLEALPFDPRLRLWGARNEDDWNTLCGNQYSGHALVGYREFTDIWERGDAQLDGRFETMLLVACKGMDHVQQRELAKISNPSLDEWSPIID
ncbi:MAG: hypothetical protein M1820_005135 [Bogoriella megaspora]|nr:MAG: hypothetical protein M1820_005135 [Bogoriella megaspora]